MQIMLGVAIYRADLYLVRFLRYILYGDYHNIFVLSFSMIKMKVILKCRKFFFFYHNIFVYFRVPKSIFSSYNDNTKRLSVSEKC